jgi:competence protein ComEC
MQRAAALGLGALLAAIVVDASAATATCGLGLGLFGLALGEGSAFGGALIGGGLVTVAIATSPVGPTLRGIVVIHGTSCSPPTGPRLTVCVSHAASVGAPPVAARGRVEVVWAGTPPPPGRRVVLVGEGRDPHRPSLPGAPDANAALAVSKIHTTVYAWRSEVLSPTPASTRDLHPLLRAIALGDRSGLSPGTLAVMRDTGTSHLLAISGSNVALVAYVGDMLARLVVGLTTRRWPAGRLHGLRPAGAIAGAVAFTALVGWPTSAQRACLTVALVTFARYVGITLPATSALGLAALGVLLLDPSAAQTASFQLSFAAVLGLVTWGPWFDERLSKTPLPAFLREGLVATAAATLGTLPIAAWWFQAFAPSGLLANAFAVPWTTFVLTPLAFGAIGLPDAWAAPFASLGAIAADIELDVLGPLAWPPWHPAVNGPRAALWLVGLALTAGRPARATLLTLVVLWPIAPPRPRDPRAYGLDVGQGSATLIETPNRWRGLIDVGPPGAGVGAWLLRTGRTSLDAVVISHADRDHAGGLVELLDRVEVRSLYVGDLALSANVLAQGFARDVPVRAVHAGEAIGPLEVLAPAGPQTPRSTRNDRSVVLALSGGIWLPGDAEDAPAPRAPSTLSAAPHHGSEAGADAFAQGLRGARWAWASVGASNLYGHPTPAAQHAAEHAGVALLRSDLHGTVAASFPQSGPPHLAWWPPGHGGWVWADACRPSAE